MKRIAPLAIVVGVIAITSPVALHAQRGGGGRGGGHNDGRGMHAPQPRTPPPHTAPAPPIPSLDHPLPYNFNAVKPAPLYGREPIPAPFNVPPGYYNRQHPLASVPYGYGYGYAAPDDQESAAPAIARERAGPAPVPAPREVPPSAAAPVIAPPPAPHPPQTMYVIPGCYGGNVPPMRAKLPKGCDIARVRVLRPPQ